VTIAASWRTADDGWLVDKIDNEPGVGWRVWHEGELAVELPEELGGVTEWLAQAGVDIAALRPVPEGHDPFCE
jgi:hypothetical protein